MGLQIGRIGKVLKNDNVDDKVDDKVDGKVDDKLVKY
ncbi:MAG: hypothetical protein K0R21_578 [Anaerocolumna sp.]|jgi:hypothetical protein|nr:hypothetical protein [Anaerocolumna sp.]